MIRGFYIFVLSGQKEQIGNPTCSAEYKGNVYYIGLSYAMRHLSAGALPAIEGASLVVGKLWEIDRLPYEECMAYCIVVHSQWRFSTLGVPFSIDNRTLCI